MYYCQGTILIPVTMTRTIQIQLTMILEIVMTLIIIRLNQAGNTLNVLKIVHVKLTERKYVVTNTGIGSKVNHRSQVQYVLIQQNLVIKLQKIIWLMQLNFWKNSSLLAVDGVWDKNPLMGHGEWALYWIWQFYCFWVLLFLYDQMRII